MPGKDVKGIRTKRVFPKQSALQGLLSGSFFNSLSYIFRYARQAVIAALFGLNAYLDAFYMGIAILETVVFSFGFVFNVIGVPHLVKARMQEDQEQFSKLTSTLFILSLFSGIIMGVVIGSGAGLLSWLAPGFDERRRHILQNGLILLLPIAVFFLPYRALGAFFRSIRAFIIFYLVECILYAVSLFAIFLSPHDPKIIFISSSLAYTVAFCVLLILATRQFDLWNCFSWTIVKNFSHMFLPLLILNSVRQILILTDRIFASFLPIGNLSALSYARLLVTVIPSVLSMHTVFLTVFAEGDRIKQKEILTRVIRFSLVVGFPLMIIFIVDSEKIISLLFERGLFTRADTQVTGSAVVFFAIGIFAIFLYPVCTAAFQVLNRLGDLIKWVVLGIIVNAVADFLFIFYFNWGVKGVAFATSLSYYIMVIAALWRLASLGIRVDWGKVIKLCMLIGVFILLSSPLLFYAANNSWQFILSIVGFCSLYIVVLMLLPISELKDIQNYGYQLLQIIKVKGR